MIGSAFNMWQLRVISQVDLYGSMLDCYSSSLVPGAIYYMTTLPLLTTAVPVLALPMIASI